MQDTLVLDVVYTAPLDPLDFGRDQEVNWQVRFIPHTKYRITGLFRPVKLWVLLFSKLQKTHEVGVLESRCGMHRIRQSENKTDEVGFSPKARKFGSKFFISVKFACTGCCFLPCLWVDQMISGHQCLLCNYSITKPCKFFTL